MLLEPTLTTGPTLPLTITITNSLGGPILYSPIFHTIYNQGLSPPLFSLSLERDISGPDGYLALGGLPPVPFVQSFTSTPFLLITFPRISFCIRILHHQYRRVFSQRRNSSRRRRSRYPMDCRLGHHRDLAPYP